MGIEKPMKLIDLSHGNTIEGYNLKTAELDIIDLVKAHNVLVDYVLDKLAEPDEDTVIKDLGGGYVHILTKDRKDRIRELINRVEEEMKEAMATSIYLPELKKLIFGKGE